VRAFELTGAQSVIVDIPLLFETGGDKRFDQVIATVCPVELQLERLQGRGLTAVEARLRLDAQMSAAEKAARADFVIRTDGTFEETNVQVERIWRQLEEQ
jgi:dephospho-CoA kinase